MHIWISRLLHIPCNRYFPAQVLGHPEMLATTVIEKISLTQWANTNQLYLLAGAAGVFLKLREYDTGSEVPSNYP
jgi:Na+-transporting NADH:ubiquinone oxidoreductase subunit NqrD